MKDNQYDVLMMEFTDEDYEAEGTVRWKIETDDEAEWLIDKVNEEMVEIARFEMALENKIAILKEKLDKVKNEKEYKIARRDGYLLEYFETLDERLKKKTKTQEKYRLPSGEIVKKYPSPQYKRDDEKLVEYLKGKTHYECFVKVKESADWGEFKKHTKLVGNVVVDEDGEIVEGVEVEERAPTLEFKEV